MRGDDENVRQGPRLCWDDEDALQDPRLRGDDENVRQGPRLCWDDENVMQDPRLCGDDEQVAVCGDDEQIAVRGDDDMAAPGLRLFPRALLRCNARYPVDFPKKP
ncbi:MAG: hypothetical protein QNJ85_19865 [Gammaproteobacteria bacterium]|nr:hypothetical protein [Gammaproteobacteria bacterium]